MKKSLLMGMIVLATQMSMAVEIIPGGDGSQLITGIVEQIISAENSAVVRIRDLKKSLSIPKLTLLSERSLNLLKQSKVTGVAIKIKANQANQIIDANP